MMPLRALGILAALAALVGAGCGGRARTRAPRGPSDAAGPAADAAVAVVVRADAGVPPDDLGATLEPIRAGAKLPALAAAVFRGDRLVAIGVAGVRKSGDPTLATVDDQWHLGSDTKAMTATVIGLYVDRGQLRLEDTLATLFAGEKLDPGYAGVTLEQLLEHRGGAPGDMPAGIWSQMWSDGAAPGARLTAVRALLARSPAQTPGSFVYANAGFMIAGAALERATGKSWDELMRRDLFGPLGMRSCGFGPPGTAGQVDQPWAHAVSGGVLTPIGPGPQADNPPSLGPAGTVHCSLTDWAKFLAVHLALARGEPTIVSAKTGARLHTPPAGGDYAGGWIVTKRSWAGGDGTVLTHSGSNTMWFATVWIAPARNLIFAVVTNRGDAAAGTAVDNAFGPLIDRYAR